MGEGAEVMDDNGGFDGRTRIQTTTFSSLDVVSSSSSSSTGSVAPSVEVRLSTSISSTDGLSATSSSICSTRFLLPARLSPALLALAGAPFALAAAEVDVDFFSLIGSSCSPSSPALSLCSLLRVLPV